MNTRRVNVAADAIQRSMDNGRRTPMGWALDLESRCLLQSPETAAELAKLRAQFAEAAATVAELVLKRGERMKVENALRDEVEELRARVAELEARADGITRRIVPTQALRVGVAAEARHLMDPAEAAWESAFERLACEHPEACSCDADYPGWKPGAASYLPEMGGSR